MCKNIDIFYSELNSLASRMKPWVIQTFDSLQFFTVVLLFFNFVILENLSILDLALSGVKRC